MQYQYAGQIGNERTGNLINSSDVKEMARVLTQSDETEYPLFRAELTDRHGWDYYKEVRELAHMVMFYDLILK